MPHDVISTCPVCASELAVTRLHCRSCGTTLEGDFSVGRFGRLNREQLTLLESFLRSRGNLREMERELGISYPTVRSRVEALVRALGFGPRADAEDDDEPTGEAAVAPTAREAILQASPATRSRRGGGRRDPRAREGRSDDRDRDRRAACPRHRCRGSCPSSSAMASRIRAVDGGPPRVRDGDGAISRRGSTSVLGDRTPLAGGPAAGRRRGGVARSRDRAASAGHRRRRDASGDVDVDGLLGDQRYRSASGDLRLRAVSGGIAIEAVSGDVDMAATGEAEVSLRTVSGDIELRAATIRALQATTTSGDVKVAGRLPGPDRSAS